MVAIAVAAIRDDGGTQARAHLNDFTIDEYADALRRGVAFPPVITFYDGREYWLADGFHRMAAHRAAGLKNIEVEARQGTRRDAILFSVGANDNHGLRRTNEDKHHAVTTLLSDGEWSKWSDREIADRCNVSHPLVSKMRSELAARTGNITSMERTFTHPKTGEPTTMDTSRIGKGGQSDPAPSDSPLPAGEPKEAAPEIRGAQIRNPINGQWLLLEAATGRVIGTKDERWEGIPEVASEGRRAAIGTQSATKEERGNNLYETPSVAVHALDACETIAEHVLMPAVGRGAIMRVLEALGHRCSIADLIDYGTTTAQGEKQRVENFLTSENLIEGEFDIVENPPYGEDMNAFIAHALRVYRPRKLCLLLNLNVLAGFKDLDRQYFMDEVSPSRIHVFKRRLPMMHRDGWQGKEASSQMNTAWFVWDRSQDGDYDTDTRINRIDWMPFAQVVGDDLIDTDGEVLSVDDETES